MENQQKLPNATATLVLGICSIFTCCFWGVGIVLGIVALALAHQDVKLYRRHPELYSNYSNVNIGKALSIIGIVISSLFLMVLIFFVSMSEAEQRDFMHNLEIKAQQQEKENQENN